MMFESLFVVTCLSSIILIIKVNQHSSRQDESEAVRKEIIVTLNQLAHCHMTRICFSEEIRNLRVTAEHHGNLYHLIEQFVTQFKHSCPYGFAEETEIDQLQRLERLGRELEKYQSRHQHHPQAKFN